MRVPQARAMHALCTAGKLSSRLFLRVTRLVSLLYTRCYWTSQKNQNEDPEKSFFARWNRRYTRQSMGTIGVAKPVHIGFENGEAHRHSRRRSMIFGRRSASSKLASRWSAESRICTCVQGHAVGDASAEPAQSRYRAAQRFGPAVRSGGV